jgi:glycosyltransferase involved in cell wall biosynthesis
MTQPRIVYLAPGDIQVARVDRQAIVYFCAALAARGASVELVALGVKLAAAEKQRRADPLALYGVRREFPVDIVPTPLHQDSPSWQVGLMRLGVHAMAVSRRLVRTDADENLTIYVKNFVPGLVLLGLRQLRRFTMLFEVHTTPRNALQRFVLRHADGVVANTHALADDLRTSGHARCVLPTHQGVDLERFQKVESRSEIRERLGLPLDRRLAVYTGKIYVGYREVESIVACAATPECREILFVLVGGREDHVAEWRNEVKRRRLENVSFTGFVPPGEVHEYQLAADVLLLYYPSGMELNTYRSPGKLFGYMASGVPIVAVDLPVLREVLGDPPAATLVPPDSPADFAAAVRHVVEDNRASSSLAVVARERVKEFTWTRRAELVLEFIDQLHVARDDAARNGRAR